MKSTNSQCTNSVKAITENTVRLLRLVRCSDDQISHLIAKALKNPPDSLVASSFSKESLGNLMNVLTIWANEPDYCDSSGTPKRLPISGSRISFASLVRRSDQRISTRSAIRILQKGGAIRVKGQSVYRIEDVCSLYGGPDWPLNPELLCDNWLSFLNCQLDLLTNKRRKRGAVFYTVNGHTILASKLPELRDRLHSLLPDLLEIDAWLLANSIQPKDKSAARKTVVRPSLGVFLDERGTRPC